MLNIILGLLLTTAALALLVLERSYQQVPARELKRLARAGDEVAGLLYRAAAYGASLRVLLNGGATILAVIALICLVSTLGTFAGVVVLLLLAGIGGFLFLPSGELTRGKLAFTKLMAPGLSRVLERLHPLISSATRLARRYRHVTIHTGLYEKSDLAELLERQRDQVDSRIDHNEITLLQHALTFGDKLVSEVLIPKRVVKMVSVTDPIGPILMDELAKSGHSRFPVYGETKDKVVGILYLRDLVGARKTGTVRDVMSQKLTYVHEEFSLYQTLQAFLKTKQHLFLVVNGFEELVGIITIEDVLEQMIGKPIVDEFDRYDDLRAVAKAAAHKEHKSHVEPEAIVESSEVV